MKKPCNAGLFYFYTMKTFLQDVLEDLSHKKLNLADLVFVLPSKRAGTYLKHYISQSLEQPIFAPITYDIASFVEEIAELEYAAQSQLLILLYESYKTEIEHPDSFEKFLGWGKNLLNDFNEVDRFLVNPEQLFSYLYSIQEINHWSLQQEKTTFMESYLALWKDLERIYHNYSKKLLSLKLGYQGLVYRQAHKKSEGYISCQTKTHIFLGFNALNTSESEIIQGFLKDKKALCYWDLDTSFFEDQRHDASYFIRRYTRGWSHFKNHKIQGLSQQFLAPKKIEIIGLPKNVAQVKYVGGLIQDLQQEHSDLLESAAIILSDETLLNPLLHALPESLNRLNITMGFPLRNTSTYLLIDSYFKLSIAESPDGIKSEDFIDFISHPFIEALCLSEKTSFLNTKLIADISKENITHITPNKIEQYGSSVLKSLLPFKKLPPQQLLENCVLLLSRLEELENNTILAREQGYIPKFLGIFQELQEIIENTNEAFSAKALYNFFNELLAQTQLDFIGHPLNGLQIMGMLESRNLDFETVIITSVNEGILPAGKTYGSFIPYDVKREMGLPTFKEKDAIFTYHFYRLLQKAKRVFILYSTEPDSLGGGEKSRLITQLLTDDRLAPYIKHTITSAPVTIAPVTARSVTKTPQMLEVLKTVAEKGFSPSSLITYLRDPFAFYKRYLLGIKETDFIEHQIAANTFGTIIHESLEELYLPYLEVELKNSHLIAIKSNVEKVVTKQYRLAFPYAKLTAGKALISFKVLMKYIHNFLNYETELLKTHSIKIISLEKRAEMDLQIPNLDFPVRLRGSLDRVDLFDGVPRIVDFKTGNVKAADLKIKNWEDILASEKKDKAFQLMCYSLLWNSSSETGPLTSGIISFKSLNAGFLPFSIDTASLIDDSVLTSFHGQLELLISELFNIEVPFTENVD